MLEIHYLSKRNSYNLSLTHQWSHANNKLPKPLHRAWCCNSLIFIRCTHSNRTVSLGFWLWACEQSRKLHFNSLMPLCCSLFKQYFHNRYPILASRFSYCSFPVRDLFPYSPSLLGPDCIMRHTLSTQ